MVRSSPFGSIYKFSTNELKSIEKTSSKEEAKLKFLPVLMRRAEDYRQFGWILTNRSMRLT